MSEEAPNQRGENAPHLTITERIQLGRSTGSHANSGIVPFPKGARGMKILELLRGKDRQKVEQLQTAGYKVNSSNICRPTEK